MKFTTILSPCSVERYFIHSERQKAAALRSETAAAMYEVSGLVTEILEYQNH